MVYRTGKWGADLYAIVRSINFFLRQAADRHAGFAPRECGLYVGDVDRDGQEVVAAHPVVIDLVICQFLATRFYGDGKGIIRHGLIFREAGLVLIKRMRQGCFRICW